MISTASIRSLAILAIKLVSLIIDIPSAVVIFLTKIRCSTLLRVKLEFPCPFEDF